MSDNWLSGWSDKSSYAGGCHSSWMAAYTAIVDELLFETTASIPNIREAFDLAEIGDAVEAKDGDIQAWIRPARPPFSEAKDTPA